MFLRSLRWRNHLPTVLHFTHAKAGSTWIDRLLRQLFSDRVEPRFGSDLFDGGKATEPGTSSASPPDYLAMYRSLPFHEGNVYPALFITRDEFLTRPEFLAAKRFVVIRDLRDAFVSHYFSMKNAHVEDRNGRVAAARVALQSLDKEDGFVHLFDRDLDRFLAIQRSWLDSGDIVLRYEDLIGNDTPSFERLFCDQLELPITPRRVRNAVEACRFEKLFGRKLGEADEKAHARQGLPGDWKNHFTPRLSEEFAKRTGDLLIVAGYETSAAWTAAP